MKYVRSFFLSRFRRSTASPDPKIRWIRPTSGTFPEGRPTVKVRDEDDDEVEGSVTVSGTVADYRLRIDEPTLTSRIEPDDTSPKIKCGRGGGEDSCGPIEDSDLASRWRRAPVMAFHDHDLGWVKTLFAASHRWSVRHADGTVETETTTKSEHVFESIGVEYCVEATRTPLPGVPGSTQTERLCIQDDGSAFAWSDAENEAQIVSTSKSWRCETLDFPNGASVPDELEDEASGGAGQGGCSVGTRYGCGAWSSVVGVALAVLARRRRSSEAASRRHSRFGSGVVASSRWRRRRSATST
jgi:hypothetical protein